MFLKDTEGKQRLSNPDGWWELISPLGFFKRLPSKGQYRNRFSINPVIEIGEDFPDEPGNGQLFIRQDVGYEKFIFSSSLNKWLGESMQDGYGDSGAHRNNQYFRRFNGMATGPDKGIGYPYDILITEHGVNWETPNNSTGNIEIESNGTVVHTLPTIGDGPAHEFTNIIIPANSIISFKRDGASMNNIQGYIIYKKIL